LIEGRGSEGEEGEGVASPQPPRRELADTSRPREIASSSLSYLLGPPSSPRSSVPSPASSKMPSTSTYSLRSALCLRRTKQSLSHSEATAARCLAESLVCPLAQQHPLSASLHARTEGVSPFSTRRTHRERSCTYVSTCREGGWDNGDEMARGGRRGILFSCMTLASRPASVLLLPLFFLLPTRCSHPLSHI